MTGKKMQGSRFVRSAKGRARGMIFRKHQFRFSLSSSTDQDAFASCNVGIYAQKTHIFGPRHRNEWRGQQFSQPREAFDVE